jgi:hypothetical protein|tara:strand:+ start:286 stop:570 length:285 start_codon:yes stop_codon:yes gene_type:complete
MKKEDRFCKVPCTEAMIPVVNPGDDIESIRILVDNYPARCYIRAATYVGSTKIWIKFDEKHPHHGDEFGTKHFRFEEPGKMQWGHSGEHMRILC